MQLFVVLFLCLSEMLVRDKKDKVFCLVLK